MSNTSESLIEELVSGLEPVRPLRGATGVWTTAAACAMTLAGVTAIWGLYWLAPEQPASPLLLLANGLLLLLGLAASGAVITMASPRVGNRHDGPRYALAMAAVFPLVAMGMLAVQPEIWPDHFGSEDSWHCLRDAVLSSLLIAGVLVMWLRRGAPVSPEQAGLYAGVGASALGTAIYGLSCPQDGFFHLGVWHAMPVVLGALVGRFALSRLLRW